MRVLLFVLETIFFLLVVAALARAWMNGLKVRMTQQPGPFVMALTNWLVIPLRRAMPDRAMRSAIDWASLLAAVVLAGIYGALAGVLMAASVTGGAWGIGWSTWALLSVHFLARTVLQGLMLLAFVYALVSWVQPMSPLYGQLARLMDPLLRPLRRWIPLIGGVDLSVLVWLVLLQIGLMALG